MLLGDSALGDVGNKIMLFLLFANGMNVSKIYSYELSPVTFKDKNCRNVRYIEENVFKSF